MSGVVLQLVKGLEHRGHVLYCDNYYSSPELFLKLRTLGFGACGTVWTNRRGIPSSFMSKASLKKGEVRESQSDELLILQWQDKREVTMIGGTEDIMKPTVIADYNTYMVGWIKVTSC